jgi:hypothetical protein
LFRLETYEKVKIILSEYPETRNSDKRLLWEFWSYELNLRTIRTIKSINFYDFLDTTPAETITRCRRAIQKSHPELRANKQIQEARKQRSLNPDWLYNK